MRCWALVVAAGRGQRMGGECPKQYLTLAGRSILEHSLDRLLAPPAIAGGVVVLAADDRRWPKLNYRSAKPLAQATGGAERCQSVLNGLRALAEWAQPDDWVLVHDAVRPCVRQSDLVRLLATLADDPVGGLLAVPVRDTLKRADAQGRVQATESRSTLWHAQTPQMFRLGLLCEALTTALDAGHLVTDEAAALEALGHAPKLVAGHHDNLKITTREDLALAEHYLHRERSQ